MKNLSRSRLLRRIEKQSRKKLIFAFLGTVLILFVVLRVGIPALAQFSLFLGNLTSSPSETQNSGPSFVQTPSLDPIPLATNSSTIKLTGSAGQNLEVEVFVDNELINKIKTDQQGNFEISSLKLKEGQSTIKIRARDGEKSSDFSQNLTIVYDITPPTLEVTSPQDKQVFEKGQNSISIIGKTESQARVTVNDFRAIVDGEGNFSYTLVLSSGENKISIKSVDPANNQMQVEKTVTFSP